MRPCFLSLEICQNQSLILDGGGQFLFLGHNAYKRPRPRSPKRDIFLPHFACRFRRKKIGKPTHRRSIKAEMAEENPPSAFRRAWKHNINGLELTNLPPCVLAMTFKPARGMQRASTVRSHVPRTGTHPSKMSKNVATLTTAKKAMSKYVYL